ncbi:MAG: pyridoxal phosphate-dependent aminotransferase [Burkholderiales bacterium]
MELSRRVGAIKPSPTLAVSARAARLKAQGKPIINLSAGEPDFDTPRHIKDAAIQAINAGFTKYTAVDGTPGLKRAVAAKFKRDNGLEFNTDQILVSCGGKQSFFNLVMATLNPGDEVVIPSPYWVSYPDIVLLAEGVPVIVYAGIEQDFKIDSAQLAAALTPRTRMVVINSPSNPSGALYNGWELNALGEVLRAHPQVLIATDDMYEHIRFDDTPFVNIVNICPDLLPRSVVLNGVSKVYAMTGWRIGYAAGPKPIITAMTNVQSQSTSNPASISQAAAEAALNGDQSCVAPMVQAFSERHRYVVEKLNRISGVRCIPSGGAFYVFPDMRTAIGRLFESGRIPTANDIELCEYLLEKIAIATVPGSAFGAEGYVRMSVATSMKDLGEALERMQRLLA